MNFDVSIKQNNKWVWSDPVRFESQERSQLPHQSEGSLFVQDGCSA